MAVLAKLQLICNRVYTVDQNASARVDERVKHAYRVRVSSAYLYITQRYTLERGEDKTILFEYTRPTTYVARGKKEFSIAFHSDIFNRNISRNAFVILNINKEKNVSDMLRESKSFY